MEQNEETFNVSVEINRGLEPLTLTVITYNSSLEPHELNFKVTRNNETLAIIVRDEDQCWKQLEGTIEQDEVDAIGIAIDLHYT